MLYRTPDEAFDGLAAFPFQPNYLEWDGLRTHYIDEGPKDAPVALLVHGEPGHAIVPELAPLPGEVVIDKPGKGAFYATPLQAELQARGITHLLVAGVTTEVCVQTTLREANDRGYDCLLLEDCTDSYFPEFKAATLAMVRAQGAIVGWTAPSTDLLKALAA